MGRYDLHKEEIDQLIKIVAKAKTPKEVEKIFDFILTPREINDIARRLKVLEMLKDGKSYTDIQSKLGISPIVIGRVSGKIGFGFSTRSKTGQKNNSKISNKSSNSPLRYKGAPTLSELLDTILGKS